MKWAFPVKMPSGTRYWTVLDDEQMEVVPAARFCIVLPNVIAAADRMADGAEERSA
jgi:hypothetical protein